jgi:outer membrane immunogenic protein
MIAALGLVAASAAQAADPPGGDIVDQIIQTMPARDGTPAPAPVVSAPPATPTVTAPSTTAPSTTYAPAPSTPIAPTTTPAPAAATPPRSTPIVATPSSTVASPTPLAAPATTPMAVSAPLAPPSRPLAPATTLDSSDVVNQMQSKQAELPPAPSPPIVVNPVPWTGFYGGLNLGQAWTTGGGNSATCVNSLTGNSSGCPIIGDSALTTNGVIGGGGIGYQMPIAPWTGSPLIVGLEGDMQGTGVNGSQHEPGPFNLIDFPGSTCSPCTFTASQQINWMGTLRARVGIPVDKFLIYGTAGLVVGEVEASQNLSFTGTPSGYVVDKKSTLSGPTAGGGVEMLLDGPWSVKIEGLYYDLGTLKTIGLPVHDAFINFNTLKTFGFEGALIRVGVTYHFGDLGAM